MRIALTAGGTGGHIIPAFSVLDALEAKLGPGLEVAFFGPENRGERVIVEKRGIRFVSIPSAAVRGRGPLGLAQSAWRLAMGVTVATRRLRSFKPDAVFSTGGYASFPASVAARLLRRPLVVFLPDVSPGWAVRVEQRLATRLATTTDAALSFLPASRTTVTGYPVRDAFATSRTDARQALGIPADAPLLVVAGASQGASAINDAVWAALPALASAGYVVHITGNAGIDSANAKRAALEPAIRERYLPAAFRDDLPFVMRAADLAVLRAGASILGELPAAGLPSILIPGTFAGGHQRYNANWLAEKGAAVVIEERDLATFESSTLALLGDDTRLASMRAAAESLNRPGAAAAIAEIVMEVARK